MKALTLTQPWASAVAFGFKHVETRSWSTKYRGQLAIHAAKGFPAWAREFARTNAPPEIWLPDMPCGAVLATARLDRIVPTNALCTEISDEEERWGDYGLGRFAWFLEEVVLLPKPVFTKGALGLWEWQR